MSGAAIAPRATRLADLPAAPALALLELVPAIGPLAALRITPAKTEGRILLELAAPTALARMEMDGDAERTIHLPRWMLAGVDRRHRDAERLVVDLVEPSNLALRSFSEAATVSQVGPEAEAMPALPELELDSPPPVGDPAPLLLDPVLLKRALAVSSRMGMAPARLRLVDHPLIGAALELAGPRSADVVGMIQVARCSLPEAW